MSGHIQPGGVLMPGAPEPPHHPIAKLFPMLAEDRRATFRASLAEKQNHPIVLHKGMLLDGRNRYRELSELKKPISYVLFIGSAIEALDFVMAENFERRDLTPSQRAWAAAGAATMRLGNNQHTKPAQTCTPSLPLVDAPADDASQPDAGEGAALLSQTEAASMFGASRRSVQHGVAVREKGAPELKEAVEAGKVSISTAADIAALPAEQQQQIAKLSEKEILAEAKRIRKEANDKRRTERVEKLKAQAAGNAALPTDKKFPIIYMDPPTKFAAGDSDRSTENHYPTMTEEDLAKLPIGDLATDDAVLFVWTTVPWLRKTLALIEGWGFAYVSEFVWDKRVSGMGFWNRNRHESLLIATRGKMPAPNPSVLEPSVYPQERTEHSAKPDYFRGVISAYYPDLPVIEMFAREVKKLPPNWNIWGNEARIAKQEPLGLEPAEAAE